MQATLTIVSEEFEPLVMKVNLMEYTLILLRNIEYYFNRTKAILSKGNLILNPDVNLLSQGVKNGDTLLLTFRLI